MAHCFTSSSRYPRGPVIRAVDRRANGQDQIDYIWQNFWLIQIRLNQFENYPFNMTMIMKMMMMIIHLILELISVLFLSWENSLRGNIPKRKVMAAIDTIVIS